MKERVLVEGVGWQERASARREEEEEEGDDARRGGVVRCEVMLWKDDEGGGWCVWAGLGLGIKGSDSRFRFRQGFSQIKHTPRPRI